MRAWGQDEGQKGQKGQKGLKGRGNGWKRDALLLFMRERYCLGGRVINTAEIGKTQRIF